MKICSKGKLEKPASEFRKSATGKDGLRCDCKGCEASRNSKFREANPDYGTNWQRENPEKVAQYHKRAHVKDPGARRRAQQKWKLQNPGHVRNQQFLREYGITAAQVDAMKAEQNHCCALCGKPAKKLCVDHDHQTKRVRAMLCCKCNWAIGLLDESPDRMLLAAIYIEKHKNL